MSTPTSFSFHTTAPIASTSQLPPPIPASLSMLPPELKALIVQKVAEADRADVEGGDDEGAWSDEDSVDEEGFEDEEEEDEEEGNRMGKVHGGRRKDWETLAKLPRGDDGNPTDEALEKVRERLLELARPSGIEALTLVSREFNEMAMQWHWRELDFESVSNESILHLITHVLPGHASHVHSLAFGQSEARMLRDDPPTAGAYDAVDPFLPLPPRRLAIVEAAERFGGVSSTVDEEGTALSSEVRSRRCRSLLVAEVIRQCRNVVRLDFEGFPCINPLWVDDIDERDLTELPVNIVYSVDHAAEAVKRYIGAGLTDLTYLVNDDGVTTEGEVAALLSACPNLLRLELETLVPSGSSTNRDALYAAFEALHKLEALNIVDGAMYLTDAFAALPLDWPNLTVLALGECEDLSFSSFRTLVERFSTSLEVLDIAGTPHANHPEDTKKSLSSGPLNLPRLNTLVLETPHESPFLLTLFTLSPIRTFSFGFCPAIEFSNVLKFLDLQQGTLKRVEVASDAALTSGQVEGLEVLCHARGVECELLEAEEDSETDLSDPSEFDIDDDDEELDQDGWSDEDGEEDDEDMDGEDGWEED